MYRTTPVIIVLATALFFSMPVTGHHSRVAFDRDETIQLQGRVVKLLWANPHIYVDLAVEDESGEEKIWVIEFEGPPAFERHGYTRDRFSPGEHLEVSANPSRRADQVYAFGNLVTFSDGSNTEMDFGAERNPELAEVTTSIAGRWIGAPPYMQQGPRPSFNRPGENWALTQAGAEALASYDELGEENPGLDCQLESTLRIMHLPFVHAIEIHEDSVTLLVEGRGLRRTIFLGVQSHDGASDARHGHSIGWWDGDALIVDTRRFTPSRNGNSGRGVPSSPLKHLVERFELGEDGKSLMYSWTLIDPVYLAEPLSHVLVFINRPDLPEVEAMACDLDSSRRFFEEGER